MSNIPSDLRYAKSHEWVKSVENGEVVVGITDYAQSSLGDITYVQIPAVGDTLAVGDVFGVVESVKAASDLYAPVSGEVIAVNDALDATPETLNQDPFGEGWIMKVRLAAPTDLEALLDGAAYGVETA